MGFNAHWVFQLEVRILTSLWTLDVRILIGPSASAESILVIFTGTCLMEVALILEEIGLAVQACEVQKIYVTCVAEAVFNLTEVGLAWSRIATIKNIMVTCLVEVDFNLYKLGLCSAIKVNTLTIGLRMAVMEYVLTIGLRMAVTEYVLTLGLCTALMVYIKVIGLPLHRIHIREIHDVLALNEGMVAVGVSEEECPQSRHLGRLGEASAGPKLICQSFQAPRAHSSLEIGSICAAQS